MTDDEVIAGARDEGFEFGWRFIRDKLVVGSTREGDDRYPGYLEERQAIDEMRDWLRRGRVGFTTRLPSRHKHGPTHREGDRCFAHLVGLRCRNG